MRHQNIIRFHKKGEKNLDSRGEGGYTFARSLRKQVMSSELRGVGQRLAKGKQRHNWEEKTAKKPKSKPS